MNGLCFIITVLLGVCIGLLLGIAIIGKIIAEPLEKELITEKEKNKQLEKEIRFKIPNEREIMVKTIESEQYKKLRKKNMQAISRAAALERERRKLISDIYKIKKISENREECFDIELVADFMIEQAEIRGNCIITELHDD